MEKDVHICPFLCRLARVAPRWVRLLVLLGSRFNLGTELKADCPSVCPASSQAAVGEDHRDAFSCQRDLAGAKFPR